MDSKLPRVAFLLGLSGLLPQMIAAAISLHPLHTAIAQFAGFLYAAVILSFLGGLWWGVAAVNQAAPRWLFGVAVVPSLVAFAAGLLWITHSSSLANALMILCGGLLLTPLTDWYLSKHKLVPTGWLAMRIVLSTGLGLLTVLIARPI